MLNEDDSYSVVVNSNLSYQAQQEAISHELQHIEKDDFVKIDVDKIEADTHIASKMFSEEHNIL